MKHNRPYIACGVLFALVACGPAGDPASADLGDDVASDGAVRASGGHGADAGGDAKGTGGAPGMGGAKGTGGAPGAGGAKGTGGAPGAGGAKGTGGVSGSGGSNVPLDAAMDVRPDGPWQVAPLPPPGPSVVYLSDLKETGLTVFDTPGGPARAAALGKDANLAGNALVINDVFYAKGLATRAYTQVWYDLAGAYKRLVVDTGLDWLEDSTRTGFEVSLDGALVYDQGNVDKADVKPLDIDVTAKSTLLLYTRTDNYNPVDKDFAIWGGARLLK